MKPNNEDLSYIINHLGEDHSTYFNAIAPPIIQTSNFRFETVEDMRNAFKDEMASYIYSRGINPTVDILRKKLAALDSAEDALIFNSGSAAVFAGIFAMLNRAIIYYLFIIHTVGPSTLLIRYYPDLG